jgi:hypothetical protein
MLFSLVTYKHSWVTWLTVSVSKRARLIYQSSHLRHVSDYSIGLELLRQTIAFFFPRFISRSFVQGMDSLQQTIRQLRSNQLLRNAAVAHSHVRSIEAVPEDTLLVSPQLYHP